MLECPDPSVLEDVNDLAATELPDVARVERHRDRPVVENIRAQVSDAIDRLEDLQSLPAGAEIAITAGSRGIKDVVEVTAAMVDELESRGFDPFIMPAMGSHGGATAEGQRRTLETLGITADAVGCEIRSSMDVEVVGHDRDDRPVYAAVDALEADAVVLANRVKLHTDFTADIESGLCKMAVIGVGKQRGANGAHNAALARSFREVIPERTAILVEKTPIVGGVAFVENAAERVAMIEGVRAEDLLDHEPVLLDRARELQPMLPVEELDLLILDEIGKNVSGTGMDTNVVGRMNIHGEPEFDSPAITRIFVRNLTDETHGNANGIGLADFAHRRAVEDVDLSETYVNAITGGQPERGRLPVVVPRDFTALVLTYSTTGLVSPADLRFAYIENTLEPDELLVSEPVAKELSGREDVTVGELRPLAFEDGEFDDDVTF